MVVGRKVPHADAMNEHTAEQTATMSAIRWYQRPVARDPDLDMVAGVIAGLCRTYGFDVRTTRIAVAIASIVFPIILVVYGAAWVVLPARPSEAVSLDDIVRDRRRIPLYLAIGIVLVAGGIGSLGSWVLFGGVSWGLGLIAVGVLLWVMPGMSSAARTAGAPTTWDPPMAGADAKPAVGGQRFVGDKVSLPASARRRPARPVGIVAVVAAFGFAGIAALGDAIDWWDISTVTALVTTLAIVAAGAAMSALVNRSWLPIPIMLMLGAVLSFLVVTRPLLDGGIGERRLQPTSLAQIDRRTELAVGELTVDLSALETSAAQVDLAMEVGIGRLHLVVPNDATVEISTELGAGELRIDGTAVADGVRHHDSRTIAPTAPTAPTAPAVIAGATGSGGDTVFIVDLRVGAGRIDIDRAAP